MFYLILAVRLKKVFNKGDWNYFKELLYNNFASTHNETCLYAKNSNIIMDSITETKKFYDINFKKNYCPNGLFSCAPATTPAGLGSGSSTGSAVTKNTV